MDSLPFRCIACKAAALQRLDDRAVRGGVTSDCKPWPRCGAFHICEECGHVQKRLTAEWLADIEHIYGEYEMYVLSGGSEQVVFDGATPSPRTRRMLECFRQHADLPQTGAMLDVGCGNGSTLRTFSTLYPGWRLAGFDLHNRFEPAVRSIPGVDGFYSGTLAAVERRFDLISMVYVVEHLTEPLDVLTSLGRLLKPGGVLLVQTSNFWDNPFDLVVADHASHFVLDTLAATVAGAGFEVIDRNDDWIAKEIGVIGRLPSGGAAAPACRPSVSELRLGTEQRLRWLGRVLDQARTAGAGGGIGVFGTAIAGTWLASQAAREVTFFVDEDRQRRGRVHLGQPVLHTEDLSDGAPVYLAFPPPLAAKIGARLRPQFPGVEFIAPVGYAAA
jgi:SAM-dependent methyltransferase